MLDMDCIGSHCRTLAQLQPTPPSSMLTRHSRTAKCWPSPYQVGNHWLDHATLNINTKANSLQGLPSSSHAHGSTCPIHPCWRLLLFLLLLLLLHSFLPCCSLTLSFPPVPVFVEGL